MGRYYRAFVPRELGSIDWRGVMSMLQISRCEVSSVLNILREIRDGSDACDIEDDVVENIEILEAIIGDGRVGNIDRNGNDGGTL